MTGIDRIIENALSEDIHTGDITTQAVVGQGVGGDPVPSRHRLRAQERVHDRLLGRLHRGLAARVAGAQEAVRTEAKVGFLLQKDPQTEDPGLDDLHRVGTVASIIRYITAPDGTHHAIARGLCRFRVLQFLDGWPYTVAQVQFVDDPVKRAVWSAVVVIVAYVDVPIVYFSVKWWNSLHQVQSTPQTGRTASPSGHFSSTWREKSTDGSCFCALWKWRDWLIWIILYEPSGRWWGD